MSQEFKSLVVKSQENVSGSAGNWTDITTRMPNIIRTMVTGKMDEENAHKVTAALTGMPSVFARAVLFKDALAKSQASTKEGLYEFYANLLDEWRGIIAALAMDPALITRKRVYLEYTSAEDSASHNVYEPKGAFGTALMDKKWLWVDSSKDEAEQTPFIDLLLLENKLIGAASPESLFFTGVDYHVGHAAPYIDGRTGKFTDPLKVKMTKDKVESLHFFASQLKQNWSKLEDSLRKGVNGRFKVDISYLDAPIQDFINDIEEYAKEKSFELVSTPLSIDKFEAPYNVIFNNSINLGGSIDGPAGGASTADGQQPSGAGATSSGSVAAAQINDPKELLLDEGTEIMEIAFGDEANDDPSKLANQPVLFLQASVEGQPQYHSFFALPLSAKGLGYFGSSIEGLLQPDAPKGQSRLTGVYNPATGKLVVDLLLNHNGQEIPLQRSYKVESSAMTLSESDLLLWPNFISNSWGKYYCFSEIPHNGLDYQAFPVVGKHVDGEFQFEFDKNGNLVSPVAEGRSNAFANAHFDLHISSKPSIQSPYKYEIIESSLPFKGVQFKRKGKDIGVVVIRYSANPNGELPYNLMSDVEDFKSATIGVDFGSTNTSVAYYSNSLNMPFGKGDPNEQNMQFRNRRVSLLRNDDSSGLKDNTVNPACEDEVFFFQNDEIFSNSIKSILTIHDEKRIVRTDEHEEVYKKEIKGGFPCFEKNLPIDSASERRYFLKFDKIGESQIVHSMKWSKERKENDFRSAYLRSLLLHVYAQMFEEKHIPERLKWSFPSSMDNPRKLEYLQIMKGLAEVNPIVGGNKRDLTVTEIRTGSSPFGAATSLYNTPSDSGNTASSGWGGGQNSGSAWGSNSAQGWGTGSSSSGTFGEREEVELELPQSLEIDTITEGYCLTESEAVANYIRGEVSPSSGNLALTFDVGGSTTDFSVLTKIGSDDVLLKQSSIQFAAQRISQATSHSPRFKQVLLRVCGELNIKIQGLNAGEDKYSSKTAPFYFEQLVDQLDDEKDFRKLYSAIAADCPELMAVNLYVTGLIIFYAGQLTKSLADWLREQPQTSSYFKNKPIEIDFQFAGKGSRIFDWHRMVDPAKADHYLKTLFIEGMGGQEVAQNFIRDPFNTNDMRFNWRKIDRDVKYEVSKGLAMPVSEMKVVKSNVVEIIGEDGWQAYAGGQMVELDSWSTITPSMYKHIGSSFLFEPKDPNMPYPRFMRFAEIFFMLMSSDFAFPVSQQAFVDGLRAMRMDAYVKSLPDYNEALKGKDDKFQFVQPMIVLCGMNFLQNVMLPKIQKNG